MTTTIELEEHQVQQLLNVLSTNVEAVEPEDAVRWTNAAASRIDRVKRDIEEQVDQ